MNKYKLEVLRFVTPDFVFSLFITVLFSTLFYYIGVYSGDERGEIVRQPEYNHVVRVDYCKVVEDTNGVTLGIWYEDELYMLDTVIFSQAVWE
jgi:hypothetical protein